MLDKLKKEEHILFKHNLQQPRRLQAGIKGRINEL